MDRSPVTTNPFDDDKLKEECGIFGILGHKDAGALAALGLHALQHRGQEAAGIVASDGRQFHTHRAVGLVGDNFGDQKVIAALKGDAAIGHVRYSTSGGTILRNIQPLFAEFEFGGFALGHNGNLTNADTLRRNLIKRGSIFQSTTDTEVIVHLMAQAQGDVTTRLVAALNQVEGAYSLTCIAKDTIIAVRDPRGVRPLVLGKLDDSWVVTSETCALDIIGADYVRDLEAGEMVVIDRTGIRSMKPFRPEVKRFCVFEYIYFARPDSVAEGISVYEARKRIGAELARESGLPADLVVPVPDSGVPAALGYAQESGIPFDLGIIRNHYVGRTFIEPTDQIRHLGVKLKHNANRAGLAGKRVILVDDSIVRGTTSKKIVEMVRQAGATEVHMRISSPPTKHSCFYGIDTPESSQLLASKNDVAAMARIIGVDSLAFISIDGLYRAMGEPGRDPKAPRFCDACFTGEYPTRLTDIEERGDNPVQASLLEIA
ncbi:MAG: amidophosphoribosyltransferase [Proteobacteria bacterium]|nr:amidophosphoribosyltransferase [Pseudomonadota bacterium]